VQIIIWSDDIGTLYSRLGPAPALYPWTEYILPRIKYVLLIWDTMITVRKFNEFYSIVLLTYFCIKIDNWQNDNIVITNFASFEPVLQKQQWGRGGSKNRFFQQQMLLYSKYVFGNWISGMCSFLNGNNCLWFSNTAYKATSATHFSVLEICIRIRLPCVIKYIICFHFLNKSCWLTKTNLNFSKESFTVQNNPIKRPCHELFDTFFSWNIPYMQVGFPYVYVFAELFASEVSKNRSKNKRNDRGQIIYKYLCWILPLKGHSHEIDF
jgi:hypothetical protein